MSERETPMPCPMCHQLPFVERRAGHSDWHVVCDDNGHIFRTAPFARRYLAIEDWNRIAKEAAPHD